MNPKDRIDNLITRAAEANINEGLSKEINLNEEGVKFKRNIFRGGFTSKRGSLLKVATYLQ